MGPLPPCALRPFLNPTVVLQISASQKSLKTLQQQLSQQVASSSAALASMAADGRSQMESLAGDLDGATEAMQVRAGEQKGSEHLLWEWAVTLMRELSLCAQPKDCVEGL